ncbi:MAG: hypothetical protein E7585_04810 [Ruminococcaceae bacterium]|nr:hypothetical protein [Oscillospiraceae bacterium]
MKITQSKKFRHGSVSVALTVAIIAAVILINAIFTALFERFTWYIDMTAEQIYTLSDEAKELLDKVKTDREVTIIFCSPKKDLEAEPSLRYPLYTVAEMTERYDNIKVRYVDILTNPSAVSQYKESSGQSLNSYSIIVTSTFEATNPTTNQVEQKTQSRVYALNALYTYDSTGTSIIGYNGEQRLVSGILAVTQVDVPVACVTIDHGEEISQAFLELLYETGYEIKPISLSTDPVPENCRLLLIFDPQEDFHTPDGDNELAKLDALLKKRECAVMFFFDHETPELSQLEAFLQDWGVQIARNTDAMTNQVSNYLIKDTKNSFDPDGIINKAVPAKTGLGNSITKQLLDATNPKPAVFKYTGAIQMPANTNWTTLTSEPDTNGDTYTYGAYYANGTNRALYDVYTSTNSAFAEAGGKKLDADAPFKYMTVTREILKSGGNSYLFACASTEFASAGALDSSYANHAVLTRACHAMGGAQVSVSLDCKYFTDTEIDSITASAANQYTVVLTVVPALAIFVTGVVIMVRRKYA